MLLRLKSQIPKEKKDKTVQVLLIILAIVLIASLWYNYRHPEVKEVTVFKPLPPIIKPVYIEVPYYHETIRTIEKATIIYKVEGLPDNVLHDTNLQITATGKVPPWKANTNVVSTFDLRTGYNELLFKQEPLPPMAFQNVFSIGAGYGIRGWKETLALRSNFEFLRLGPFHFNLYGEANTRPELCGMVFVDVELSSRRR